MACCCSLFYCLAAFSIIAAIIIKIYLKLRIRRNGCMNCLVGKTIIVTGANAGIGYETALDFAQRGARVILACRNKDRAEDAVHRIKKATGNSNVVYKLVDLASFKSIRDFANDINATEDRIDVLVNNAGGTGFGNQLTEDGLQINFQINYVGPFLLTHLLLNKLKKSSPSRIVNVSSFAASIHNMDVNTLNTYPEDRSHVTAEFFMYCIGKLGNILFTTELAKKLDGTDVAVNALHPGAVDTEFQSRFPPYLKKIFTPFMTFYKNSREGAETTIYVALSKDIEGVTGKLFDNCKEIGLYKTAQDPNLAKQLWQKTEEYAKLKPEEKLT